VVLTAEERVRLERRASAPTSPQRDALRARIVLWAAEGEGSSQIAERLGISLDMVCTWRGRFAREGVDGLEDRTRCGRPPRISPVQRCEIVATACEPPPAENGLAGWTLQRLGDELRRRGIVEISRSHLHTILQRADLRPHKKRMWLHSPDPQFRQKVTDIVQLYLNPPEGATVLCVDEKTGMQALERKHPDQPARPGMRGRREFHYVRHGTQTLISAFDVHSGRVLSRCGATRTAEDLEGFMERIAEEVSGPVHVIWDNLNIHYGERWERFNARHGGRFTFHYTPVHASWVNQVELWFGILQRRCLTNGSFRSAEELRSAVEAFVSYWNLKEKHPFRWSFTGYPGAREADLTGRAEAG
jgi:transposase